jgi:IS4 transposase
MVIFVPGAWQLRRAFHFDRRSVLVAPSWDREDVSDIWTDSPPRQARATHWQTPGESRPLRWIRATYRSRFGIESSYRQSHQARIRTSSRKPALRLLFVGVALVLRNVWVWLHAEVMAQPQRGTRQQRPQSLRFARLLLWLMMEVARHYRLLRKIPVYHDLYERAHAFGIVFNY